ncbi:MAG: NAD(P)H-hydrate dehydratase [Candidatus Omnitrophota bacterium]
MELKWIFKKLVSKRNKGTHKGDFGHVFILAGSKGMTGAAVLCSKATLRSGAGLATLGIPSSLNNIIEKKKAIEVMTLPLPETKESSFSLKGEKRILKKISLVDVVLIGPGISRNSETRKLILKLIPAIKKPMVLDADALNNIVGNLNILKNAKAPIVVTPHPGEMARLINKDTAFIKKNRLIVAKKFSNHYNAVVVLKGKSTVVAKKSSLYINKTGNSGMSTAGSGDVLTGMIGGFLAQGLDAFDSARLGVYLHGLAGDIAAKKKTRIGLIASDILESIPEAISFVIRNA